MLIWPNQDRSAGGQGYLLGPVSLGVGQFGIGADFMHHDVLSGSVPHHLGG
jgi:hypothetical protein